MNRKSKIAEFIDEKYTINVFGRNVLVTDAIRDYVIEKVSKVEKFRNRIIDINVTLDVQKLEQRVDIVMKVDHIKISSSASSDNLYASIDSAADKLQKQLLKYKGRIQEHTARAIADIEEMNVNVISKEDEIAVINDEIESENRRSLIDTYMPHEIVSKEKCLLKTLSNSEAVMKIDLSNDNFLIFRSEEDRKIKVIYRRGDGNYGIIEVKN